MPFRLPRPAPTAHRRPSLPALGVATLLALALAAPVLAAQATSTPSQAPAGVPPSQAQGRQGPGARPPAAQAPTPPTAGAQAPGARPTTPQRPAPQPISPDRALAARLDTFFAAAFPPDQPGAAVRVQRGDVALLRQAYGMADVELGVEATPDMVFRIGSLTKLFTAVAVYRLAAAGELRLEAPLRTYLPDYPEPGASVTLHQLLTHTGGIPSYTNRAAFWERAMVDRSPREMIATWADDPLDFAPGTAWSYSNSGYFLLGAVIEAVTGQSYAEHLRDTLLRPLGLRHTWYGDPRRIVPGRVRGYQRGEDGLENAPYLAMSLPYSAGGLLSTVDDLVAWQQKLFQGNTVLAESWRRRLLTPARVTGGGMVGGRRTGYAGGVGVRRYAGEQILMHGGGINGFSSFLAYVPARRLTVVVLSNQGNPSPSVASLGRQAVAIALGQPLGERPRARLSRDELGEYAGVYEIDGEWPGAPGRGGPEAGDDDPPAVVVRIDGEAVTLQEPGGGREEVRFSARDQFYFPGTFNEGRFERAPGGRVAALVWAAGSQGERRAEKSERAPPRREPVELEDLRVLDALTGTYELLPGLVLTVSREGDALYAQATGQTRDRIYPASEGRWFWRWIDAELVFAGWRDGEADSATLMRPEMAPPGRSTTVSGESSGTRTPRSDSGA